MSAVLTGVVLIAVAFIPLGLGAIWLWRNDRGALKAIAVFLTLLACVVAILAGVSILTVELS